MYSVINEGDNRLYALKLYHKSKTTPDAAERINELVKLGLNRLDSRICAPFDTVSHGNMVGHISPFASGVTILEALEEGQLTFPEVFELALGIVSIMETLRKAGVIHGDLQTQNFKVEKECNGLRVMIIDLDNYSAPGASRPNMVGMTLYMAPELRERFLAGKRVYPTELSDRYALGVLLHEVLLHFHPIAGFDQSVDDINAAMLAGWAYDPDLANPPANPHGYPVKSLNPEIIKLIQDTLSPRPSMRPSIERWNSALENAKANLLTCTHCQVPFVSYKKRKDCPFGHPIKRCVLRLGDGRAIPLARLSTTLGRKELGGSKYVSRRHLIVRKTNNSLSIESIGMNPSCIRRGNTWRRLNPGEVTKLKPNDRLLIAGTPLQYMAK